MRVAIRADASLRIGSGHAVRCAALAEALRFAGCEVLFLTRELPGNLADWLRGRGHDVALLPPPSDSEPVSSASYESWLGVPPAKDAEDCEAALANWGRPDWLVVDHYGLKHPWESQLRKSIGRMLVIDDIADGPHDCDLLLNQNLGASAAQYAGQVPATCRLLLGPAYSLLRPQFAAARKELRQRNGKLRRLLICFGGVDVGNTTGQALEGALAAGLGGLQIEVVIGTTNPHRAALEQVAAGHPNVRLLCGVENMAELMAAADLFLGSSGTMTWERAAVGLPGLVAPVAANQEPLCRAMAEAGADLPLGSGDTTLHVGEIAALLRLLDRQPWWLTQLSERAAQITDGQGAQRVTAIIAEPALSLRLAAPEDCDDIFEWRNHPSVRQYSGQSEVLALETHRSWFARCLTDPDRDLLIAQATDGTGRTWPVGVLRLDVESTRATVSIYLVPNQFGNGFGVRLLNLGELWIRDHRPDVTRLEATVRAENKRSQQAFRRAGYVPDFEQLTKGL